MKIKNIRLIIITLLIPVFIEAINTELFSINIPGFPLTLGRTFYVLCGILGILHGGALGFKTKTVKAIGLIILGCFVGALYSADMAAFSRTIALLLLLIASVGIANIWKYPTFQYVITTFFVINFLYWGLYVLNVFISSGMSYSSSFHEGNAINHHVPGMNLSVSSIFIAVNLFYKNGKLKILGYVVIVFAAIACMLAETRSNFLFTILALILIFFKERKSINRLILLIIPFFIASFFLVTTFLNSNENLSQRFDIDDMDYQERTTGMRVDFIYMSINEFMNYPLGKGILNTQVLYNGRTTMVHNQYLYFIIAGGFLALIGVFIWLRNVFVKFSKIYIKKTLSKVHPYLFAIFLSTSIFFMTLFTIDSTGLLFFIILSLSCMLDISINKSLTT